MSSFVLRSLLFAMLAMVASAQTPPAIESGDQLETGGTEDAGYTLTPDDNPDGAHSLTQQDVEDGKVKSFTAKDVAGVVRTFTWNEDGFYEVLGLPPNYSQYRFLGPDDDGNYTYELGSVNPATGGFDVQETGVASPGLPSS